MDLEKFQKDVSKYKDVHKQTIKHLRKIKPRELDNLFHTQHEEVFSYTDCLDCANCCKTTSPIFQEIDIERVAKALKMKISDFVSTYLHKDEDNDYVLNETPCPFLGHENKCIVYESRPKACREYPHTNRKRMHQILKLTLKNTTVCPAVHDIMLRIDAQMK